MNLTIMALEKLIETNAQKIENTQKQIKDYEINNIKISAMKQGSLETTLEEATKQYEKYKKQYDEIPQAKREQYDKEIRIKEALAKQTYYKLQKIRLKKNLNLKRNQKLEAMMIIDELPDDIHFEDENLIDIVEIVIKHNIRDITEIEKEYQDIKKDFEMRIDILPDEKDLKHFTYLDTYIPIIILHFSIFVKHIQETIEEFNADETNKIKVTFRGLPKYEDWWIEELFQNHQAYFGLFKWKSIIENQCLTPQLKIIWQKIFTNWLMIKKLLNNKEDNAYDYNFIFDNMIRKYAQLEEELDDENLKTMEKIVHNITTKEDFTKMKTKHDINTVYLQWKRKRIQKA